MAVYGGSGGPSVNANFDKSSNSNSQTTNTNAQLQGNNVNIVTTGDMTVEGANIHANTAIFALVVEK